MQNQIKANKHRIGLLDNLNKTLMNSIRKLSEKRNSIDNSQNILPSPLNQSKNNNTDLNQSSDNYFMRHKDSRSESLVETPKKNLMRPVPLFKLENELDESEITNEKK
jgi:hypothetical protein